MQSDRGSSRGPGTAAQAAAAMLAEDPGAPGVATQPRLARALDGVAGRRVTRATPAAIGGMDGGPGFRWTGKARAARRGGGTGTARAARACSGCSGRSTLGEYRFMFRRCIGPGGSRLRRIARNRRLMLQVSCTAQERAVRRRTAIRGRSGDRCVPYRYTTRVSRCPRLVRAGASHRARDRLVPEGWSVQYSYRSSRPERASRERMMS
jgi:hypothetical protein